MREIKEIECVRCRTKFHDPLKERSFSSFSFPIYSIQRYKDFDSRPKDIHLCKECSDKLDRFLYIYTEGQDYYRDYSENTNEQGESSDE